MRLSLFHLILAFSLLLTPGLSGCATIRTMPDLGSYGSPKVFSGTRLDYNAAAGDEADLKRFNAAPPSHPVLDLPFSALLDAIILVPVTLPLATYELVFPK